jgi:hypothetical protein
MVTLPAGVHDPDVAGVQPALGVDGLGRGLGVLPVARHDGVAPHHDLAGLPRRHSAPAVDHDPHLEPGDGPARGGGDDLGRIAAPAHGDGAARLGEAVGGEDGVEAELGAHGVHQLDRDDGRAGDPEPERGEVVSALPGGPPGATGRGSAAREHGDPLGRHALHDPVGVEDRLGHHGGPGHEAGQDARLVAEGVEEGVDDEVAVAPRPARRWTPRWRRCAATGRGWSWPPLGVTGRARGEDEVGEVVGPDRPARAAVVGRVDALAPPPGTARRSSTRRWGRPAVPARPRGCPVASSRRRTMRSRSPVSSPVQQRRVVDTQEAAHGDERGGPDAQDVGRLGPLEPGVQRHQHGPGPQEPQGGQHPLGAVGGPDGHPVPRPTPGGHEAAGVAVDLLGQLGEGQADGRRRPGPRCAPWRPRARRPPGGDGAPGQVGPGVLVPGGVPPPPPPGRCRAGPGVTGAGCSRRRPRRTCRTSSRWPGRR